MWSEISSTRENEKGELNMNYEVVEEYLKKVERSICNLYPAENLIKSMRECFIDYCGDHPQCTAEELEKIFGSPEEVARYFLEDKGVTRPSKNKKMKMNRLAIIAALAVVTAALLADRAISHSI